MKEEEKSGKINGMEPNTSEVSTISSLHRVTPLSKYLAMILFILMPFIGGWIGYQYALETETDDVVLVQQALNNEEVPNITPHNFHYHTTKVGEQYGGMVVEKISSFKTTNEDLPQSPTEGDISISFLGKITLEGKLKAPPDVGLGPEYSISNLTEESLQLLPRSETDNRSAWFGIENPEVILQRGLKNGDQVEVVIDRYTYNEYPSAVWNTAHIVSAKSVGEVVIDGTETLDGGGLNGKPAFVTNIGGVVSGYVGNNYLLGDSSAKTIYKYNPQTSTYEVLVEDVRNLKNFDQMNVRGLSALQIYGWSDDLRYLGIRETAYEGIVDTPLYYLDTQDMESGFHTVPDFRTSSAKEVISPDGTRILGFEATFVSTETVQEVKGPDWTYQVFEINEQQLNMFDLNDLNAQGNTKIYGPLDDTLTFLQPNFSLGGHYINGRWIDENTVELKVSTVENYKMLASSPSEASYAKFDEGLDVAIIDVE